MKNCPICNSELVHETRERKLTYNGKSKVIMQPAEYCDNCGEGFLSPADSKATETVIADFIGKKKNR
jgi:YgiT-type zinc finger domain-containing protein